RRRAPQMAAAHGNAALLDALRARALPVTVATVGFTPVVEPLVAAFDLPGTSVVAARISCAERRRGKLAAVNDALGAAAVTTAMVLSDSPEDQPLLAACAHPLHVVWPGARYVPALGSVYLPGEYLARVKRPGERYVLRGVLQDDFAYWVLSSIALAAHPLFHGAGLLLLLLSFWTIYERGYVDNDIAARAYEHDPKLSPEFFSSAVATPTLRPWLWAAALGAAGIYVLRWPDLPRPADGLRWAALLAGTYGWFRLYNRMDKGSRVWMFSVLQLARGAAFVVLVPVPLIGVAALVAHVVARWIPYYVYRLGGKGWPELQPPLIRLMFFVLLALLLAVVDGPSLIMNYTALALLLWTAFRARHDLVLAARSARRIDVRRRDRS
ncbi:MAG: hypothetical protein KGL25_11915, partial [Gammaproteobacteria bacterium]|nr:hypothetical protein [Gammaproteobacteria bacterium]